mmetsp:Transcript_59471/g.141656  ORF Transcript_59471/g.141656 Transcript_59471/m.141656 type:complete len:133 (+) Transcript_59471:77-475(+)
MGADPEEDDAEDDEGIQDDAKLSADAAQAAKQLDSITDFHEDKDESAKFDIKEVEQRLQDLKSKQEEATRQRAEREAQLAAVKIKKEDVELMCAQLPLCEKDALERVLREHDGNLVEALRSAVRKFPTGASS